MGKLLVKRKGYTRKGGVRVRGTAFKIKDRGAPGRTPKSKRWFAPKGNLHGWSKDLSQQERIRKASMGRTDLSSGRALNQLANVTTDRETRKKAKEDAGVFFRRLKRK